MVTVRPAVDGEPGTGPIPLQGVGTSASEAIRKASQDTKLGRMAPLPDAQLRTFSVSADSNAENHGQVNEDSLRRPSRITANRVGEFVTLLLAGSLAASLFVTTSRSGTQTDDPREAKEALRKVLTDDDKTDKLIHALTTSDIVSDLTADPAVAKSLGRIASALDVTAKDQSRHAAAQVERRLGTDKLEIG